ncbi:poly(A)-specific ribonuclease [Savitreella phatthalungensis]
MADWTDVYVHSGVNSDGHLRNAPITCIAFDSEQELLIVGHEDGIVITYYGLSLQKYTSVRAHKGPVLDILATKRAILTLARGSLHAVTRAGVSLWSLQSAEIADACCMTLSPRSPHDVLLAGTKRGMVIVNFDNGTVTQTLDNECADAVVMRRHNKMVVVGSTSGEIRMYDPMQTACPCIAHMPGHPATIKDLLSCGGVILTSGFSARFGNYQLETVVKTFDPRTLRPMMPVPCNAGAAFLRAHPRMTTTAMLLSYSGTLQVIDTGNVANLQLRQLANMSYITAFDIARNGSVIAYVDSENNIHLASAGGTTNPSFLDAGEPTLFADLEQQLPEYVDVEDEHKPLHTVGMPYYWEELLSSWPSNSTCIVGKPPQKVDPDLLTSMKLVNGVGHCLYNQRRPRNTIDASDTNDVVGPPRFLSEKAKTQQKTAADGMTHNLFEDMGKMSIGTMSVPNYYRRMEIRYSKFGIEDFDFEYFNGTSFAGLETAFANTYCNSILQVMHASTTLKQAATSHASTNCLREYCLLCELGYVCTMLDNACGLNCHSTNFLRAFAQSKDAQALGLVLPDDATPPPVPLATLTQTFTRFLLETLCRDAVNYDGRPSPQAANTGSSPIIDMDSLVGIYSKVVSKCVCGLESVKPHVGVVTDLVYSAGLSTSGSGSMRNKSVQEAVQFSTVLRTSVHREGQSRGWCPGCRQYQPVVVRRIVQTLPPVLCINASSQSPDAWRHWAGKNWPPTRIGLSVSQGKLNCWQGRDLEKKTSERGGSSHSGSSNGGGRHAAREKVDVYLLRGLVVEVRIDRHDAHMVTFVRLGSADEERPRWVLFNDFLVKEVSEEEALTFAGNWKVPAVVIYEAVSSAVDNRRILPHVDVDTSILYTDWPRVSAPLRPSDFTPLPQGLTLDAHTLVAIDAEFVSLQQEEIELRSDGSRQILQPRRNSLARVSVLTDDGRPFIDDYITTTSPIVDYLTEYSGIHEGDLDPKRSKYAPIPLKMAYKKLYALVRLGCRFVGHGLRSDFRTINLMLPKEQVVDTVELFFLPERGGRKLSLKFLAWYFLDEKIQQAEHDSIEDARTALKLWRKYQDFVNEGTLDLRLQELYDEGRGYNFRPPDPARQAKSQSTSPVKLAVTPAFTA